ncbi:MAG: DUF4214 domain-containing protein, partial [Actinomycetota bacterium]
FGRIDAVAGAGAGQVLPQLDEVDHHVPAAERAIGQPDQGGFDYWVSVRNGGATLSDIAFQFAYGPEFAGTYGSLSDGEFVDLVYDNVLCRAPDDAGRAYWAGLLADGSLSRWDMMVNFVELREYLARTGTCHSIYPAEAAAVGACPEAQTVPLGSASIASHGYRSFDANWATGSFRGVEVDLTRPVFETGSSRCSVASINANWLVASEKDRPNPGVLGIGVVDGVHVKGSADRTDRGVFGLRFDPAPASVVEVWPGDTLSADDRRLNSVAGRSGDRVVESWHAAAELSPYLSELAPAEIVGAGEWVWAAAGVPLLIDGQLDSAFGASYANDPYTYQTRRHTFVAVDQDTDRLVFGGTATLDVADLVDWAQANGYEDLIKFDGGASAEFNIGGQAVVAGTNRGIPVWFGVGC